MAIAVFVQEAKDRRKSVRGERRVEQLLHARFLARGSILGDDALARGGIEFLGKSAKHGFSRCRILGLNARYIFFGAGAHGTLDGLVPDPPYFTLLVSFDCRCILYCQRGPPYKLVQQQ